MSKIDVKKLAVNVLNALVARDDIPVEVMNGLYTAIILLDPQPEDNFSAALYDALEIVCAGVEELEKIVMEAEYNEPSQS